MYLLTISCSFNISKCKDIHFGWCTCYLNISFSLYSLYYLLFPKNRNRSDYSKLHFLFLRRIVVNALEISIWKFWHFFDSSTCLAFTRYSIQCIGVLFKKLDCTSSLRFALYQNIQIFTKLPLSKHILIFLYLDQWYFFNEDL